METERFLSELRQLCGRYGARLFATDTLFEGVKVSAIRVRVHHPHRYGTEEITDILSVGQWQNVVIIPTMLKTLPEDEKTREVMKRWSGPRGSES